MTGPLPGRLNLGCGHDRRPDCLNVDKYADFLPDLVWDLDRRPFPLPRDYFEHILARDVVEHVANIQDFLGEGHCANSFIDPTHRHHLGLFSFDFFEPDSNRRIPSPARFKVVERSLVFHQSLVNRVVLRLAMRFPEEYERRFAWLFPAWFMTFKLTAVK